MNSISVAHYLQLIERYWQAQDGSKLSSFLSIRHEHAQYPNYHVESPEGIVERFLGAPVDELVILHLKCLYALSTHDYLGAFNLQNTLVQTFTKILQSQKDENWSLPLMYTICQEVRLLAQLAERQRTDVTEKPGEILEKAAECLMGCFRVCAADNRSAEEDTKRIGMLALVNQLFKVYFRINKLHLCKPLIRAIESSSFKESFSLSQQITYRYFVGRQAIFAGHHSQACDHLTYAFENCHISSKKNKRLILLYLVPLKMLLGYRPKKSLLEKYDLVQLWDLVQAVCKGDLRTFDQIMETQESFFIKCGIYLIIGELKSIAYRNLFRKVYLMEKTFQIPVACLQTALVYLGQEDVDLDETECIVANLIFEGKIRGYISHVHRKVVVSKQAPFPSLLLANRAGISHHPKFK